MIRRYSRWLLWVRSPLAVLITACLTSLVCGIFVAEHALFVSLLLGLVVLLGIAWPWIAIRAVRGQVEFRVRRGVENVPVDVQVVVRNRWPMPVWGLILECTQDRLDNASGEFSTALATLRGCSTGDFQWSFIPTKRGVYPKGSLSLVNEFPFGLWKSRRPLDVRGKTIVWPQLVSLPFEPHCDGEPTWDGLQWGARRTETGEPEEVRLFRYGDSPRAIHWPLTARYDTLMVRQSQPRIRPHATVILRVVSDPVDADQLSAETSLRLAASLARCLIDSGAAVDFDGGTARHELSPSNSSWQTFMDRLAELPIEPGPPESIPLPRRASTSYLVTNDMTAQPPEGTNVVFVLREEVTMSVRSRSPQWNAGRSLIIVDASTMAVVDRIEPGASMSPSSPPLHAVTMS